MALNPVTGIDDDGYYVIEYPNGALHVERDYKKKKDYIAKFNTFEEASSKLKGMRDRLWHYEGGTIDAEVKRKYD